MDKDLQIAIKFSTFLTAVTTWVDDAGVTHVDATSPAVRCWADCAVCGKPLPGRIAKGTVDGFVFSDPSVAPIEAPYVSTLDDLYVVWMRTCCDRDVFVTPYDVSPVAAYRIDRDGQSPELELRFAEVI